MTSHESRRLERDNTRQQFHWHSLRPQEFVHTGPPTAEGQRANAERALTWAANAQADLLLVEDDIDLAPDFPTALEAVRTAGTTTTLCLFVEGVHPPAWLIGTPPSGLYPVSTLSGWHGTQAIYLPNALVKRLVARATFGDGKGPCFDIWLKRTGLITDLRVALPNPVQHRSPRNVRGPPREPRRSLTYTTPRVHEGGIPWPSR